MYEIMAILVIAAGGASIYGFCYFLTKDDKELHGRGQEEFD